MLKISLLIPILLLINPFAFLFPQSVITYEFDEDEIRDYIPICTNNITADKLYARIARSGTEKAYEFLLYWEHQDGSYKLSEHEHDWEFIVVYVDAEGLPTQISYDSWHYYIGRETRNIEAYSETNVLMYVDPAFHYFRPDIGIRSGNVSWQINNQTIYNITSNTLSVAQEQVGFDSTLFDDPFSWKHRGLLGRYTAFDSWWKAFLVVTDKNFEFIDLSDESRLLTKWL